MKKLPVRNEKAFDRSKALADAILVVVRGGTGSTAGGPVPPPHPNV
jgi:hypothetical protein